MTQDWKVAGLVIEGERINVGGVNPWNHKWHRTEEPAVDLPHPQHTQELHRMNDYNIESGGRTIVFAATELSAGVYGFYVPV